MFSLVLFTAIFVWKSRNDNSTNPFRLRGDIDAIEYFLYEKMFKTDEEAWLYIYIAQHCDVDLTQDDFRAYNAYTGEDYDDYGPIAISGREAIQYAINLPELNKEKDDLARKLAQELFEEI